MSNEGYARFAGRCRKYAEAAIAADPTLRLACGWYHCPMWGKRGHWWAVKPDGTIVDPTVTQFPTSGAGADYEEYDGTVECANCGKDGIREDNAILHGHYAFCGTPCALRFVGL